MSWTLAQEIAEITHSADCRTGLHHAGVLKADEDVANLLVHEDWRRAGAEMYTYVFGVVGTRGTVRKLILKSYVPTPGTVSVSEGLQQLLQRREQLASFGVAVPTLIGASSGTICEDFVPHSLWERLPVLIAQPTSCAAVLASLFKLAFAIDTLQFAPLDPFTDLRTDDRYAYVVDFGQDLGPSCVGYSNMSITEELRDRLRDMGLFSLETLNSAENAGRSSAGPSNINND